MKNMALNGARKALVFIVLELKQEGGALPCSTSARNISSKFGHSTHVHSEPKKAL